MYQVTAILPNGQRRVYSGVEETEVTRDGKRILMSKNRVLIAALPAGCVVEWVRPAAVYEPTNEPPERIALRLLRERITGMTQYRDREAIADLKRTLRRFDARDGTWRKADA